MSVSLSENSIQIIVAMTDTLKLSTTSVSNNFVLKLFAGKFQKKKKKKSDRNMRNTSDQKIIQAFSEPPGCTNLF